MAKQDMTTIILVLVVAALGIWYFTSGSTSTTPSGSDGVLVDGTCAAESVAFTPKLTRLGKAGTTLGAGHNYYIVTDNLGSSAANAATTVPTNYNMKVIYGENSTTYYSVVKDVSVGCANPTFDSVQLALADTSLNSLYAQNSDGTVNSASNPQEMDANDVFETTITFKAGTDTYFGNPDSSCKNVAIVEYDKTFFKSVSSDSMAAVPGAFTYTNSSYDGAQAFFIPKSANGADATFNLKIESTSTAPTGANSPILHLWDCDIDKNEDTLEIIHGVEDEDLNRISLVPQTLTIYVE